MSLQLRKIERDGRRSFLAIVFIAASCWIVPATWGMKEQSFDVSAEVPVSIDFKEIGFPDVVNLVFSRDGVVTKMGERKVGFLSQCDMNVKLVFAGGEVKNKSGKVVANAGLFISEYIISKDNPSISCSFKNKQHITMFFRIFKEDYPNYFVIGNKLPEEWATEDSGDLSCTMTIAFVANK
ncbi:MAG: hypothetical protein LBE95_00565 [Holosporaceae bacterium]|nr:hypothetical protein [Holosporaceae bacterium]